MSLQFMVQPNQLVGDGSYMPKVVGQPVFTYGEVLEDIQNNTTLRSHDAELAIRRLTMVLLKQMSRGYKVEMPFGVLRPTVHGSFASETEDFEPWNGNTNHEIDISFRPNRGFLKQLAASCETERISDYALSHPKIHSIRNVSRKEDEGFRSLDIISITGVNLKHDPEAEDEGLFWSDGNGTRVRTPIVIDNSAKNLKVQIPELEAGSYELTVVSRLGNHQLRSSFYEETVQIST